MSVPGRAGGRSGSWICLKVPAGPSIVRMPIGKGIRPVAGESQKFVVGVGQPLDANLPRPLRCGRPAKEDHCPVGGIAGVVLNVGATGQLLPVGAVRGGLTNVSLDGL